jgi:hypothetical protein
MRAEDLLPDHLSKGDFDGVSVRKGTAGAFLVNARVWIDASAAANERIVAERDIVDSLPALRALGLFNVLQIRDPRLQALVDSH